MLSGRNPPLQIHLDTLKNHLLFPFSPPFSPPLAKDLSKPSSPKSSRVNTRMFFMVIAQSTVVHA